MSVQNTHYGSQQISTMLEGKKSIFFIGIGGINMSSLALISKQRGYKVGGSDRTRSAITEHLEGNGIELFYAHDDSNLNGYEAVVYTVAISEDNPEYVKACEAGIPCISRADFMGYLMVGYNRRIGISGMHGKSTCTSMCASVFIEAETDPTVLSGASMKSMGGAYRIGGADNFIFEACEYMDSFLDFYPTVAVILNIEMDHVDYFKSMDHIYSSFGKFANITLPFDGCVVYNADDVNVEKAIADYSGRKISFSAKNSGAMFYADNICFNGGCPEFDVKLMGEDFCRIRLSVTGEHNIYNALATCAVAYLCGIGGAKIASGLAGFTGADRRMEYKGSWKGAAVYDDYGHHPTEIKKTLEGVAKMGYNRVICVFQPHTFSRTAGLFSELVTSFESVDMAIIADIYAAREKDNGEVSAKKVADAIPNAVYKGGFEEIAEYLGNELKEGDLLVVMGAGDVFKIYDLMDLKKEEECK
jgi:UDP-N-acetylmuramate--alanine ligase